MYIQLHDTYVLMCMVLKHIDDTWVYGGYVWNKSIWHWYRPLFVLGYAAWVCTLYSHMVVLGLSLYNRPQLIMVLPFGISKFFDVCSPL